MELIEPEAVFAQRCGVSSTISVSAQLRRPQPRPRPVVEEFWTAIVLSVLRDYGDEPMRITSLVNEVARQGDDTRDAPAEALGHFGQLLRAE